MDGVVEYKLNRRRFKALGDLQSVVLILEDTKIISVAQRDYVEALYLRLQGIITDYDNKVTEEAGISTYGS